LFALAPVRTSNIRTFGTAEDASVLAGLGISIAPTFPSREIRKRRARRRPLNIGHVVRNFAASKQCPQAGQTLQMHRQSAFQPLRKYEPRWRGAAALRRRHID